jgi:AcrR family transcriptional regulator
MARAKKRVPPARRAARTHDELPRHSDWQNPKVVQILDAAARCFGRDGLANTTIQQIAGEAGMTKSMIHYYFESKQVLILELQAFVHERYFRRVQSKLDKLSSGSSTQLEEALWEVFDIVGDKNFLLLQLELFAEAGRDANMRNRMMLAQERTRELVEMGTESVAPGDAAAELPKALALMISSQLLGLRVQELVGEDPALTKEAYRMFIAMVRRSLGPERNAD